MFKIKMAAIAVFAGVGVLIPVVSATAAPTGVWTNNSARNEIIRRESGGNPNAVNPSSGARGLYQCLPSVNRCPSSDVNSQHQWGQSYMQSRYGTWENALAHHNNSGWW